MYHCYDNPNALKGVNFTVSILLSQLSRFPNVTPLATSDSCIVCMLLQCKVGTPTTGNLRNSHTYVCECAKKLKLVDWQLKKSEQKWNYDFLILYEYIMNFQSVQV